MMRAIAVPFVYLVVIVGLLAGGLIHVWQVTDHQAAQITALRVTQAQQGHMMVTALNPAGGNNEGAWATVRGLCESGRPAGGLTQAQLDQLCREWAVPQPKAAVTTSAVQRTGAQRDRCAYGATSCVSTPNRSGPYGPGTAGVGLLITGGSEGTGGTPFMVTDTEPHNRHAPEVWVSGGTLYVLTRPGWLGSGICIDVALRHNYCLSARDIIWTHKHDRR